MGKKNEERADGGCTCPICAAWAAYKRSDAARHLRVMQKEALLAVRSALDWCIARSESRHQSTGQDER